MLNKYVLIVGIASLTLANTISNAGTLGRLTGIEIPNELDVSILSNDESGRITRKGKPTDHPNIKGNSYNASELQDFIFTVPYRGWHGGSGQIHLQVFVKNKPSEVLSTATLWDEDTQIILQQTITRASSQRNSRKSFSKIGRYCESYVPCKNCICDNWKDHEVDVDITLKIDKNGYISIPNFNFKRANWGTLVDGEDTCNEHCQYLRN